MAKVVYAMNLSLDGFIKDADGGFDWSVPREDLHRLANEQVRGAAALLYGRRLYETMEAFWTTAEQQGGLSPVELEFARAYVATPRIVFSDTLERVGEGARLVRSRDAVAEVRRLKAQPSSHLDVGGAGLAASLADLIDEFWLWVHPVVVGGGTRYFPAFHDQFPLTLIETRTLSGGVVVLRYERADR